MALGWPEPAGNTAWSLAVLVSGIGVCSCSRGMRWLNLAAPNSLLRGVPVGTSAKALRANGLSPFLQASNPVVVRIPHLKRSRLVIWPSDSALTISARLSRAFWASLCRMREALLERYMFPSLARANTKSRYCRPAGTPVPRARMYPLSAPIYGRRYNHWAIAQIQNTDPNGILRSVIQSRSAWRGAAIDQRWTEWR